MKGYVEDRLLDLPSHSCCDSRVLVRTSFLARCGQAVGNLPLHIVRCPNGALAESVTLEKM